MAVSGSLQSPAVPSSPRLGPANRNLGRKRLLKAKAKAFYDKREKFKIVIDGKDYTPRPLAGGSIVTDFGTGKEDALPVVDAIFSGISQSGASMFVGGGGFHSKIASLQSGMSMGTQQSISQMESSMPDVLSDARKKGEEDDVTTEKVPSQFLLPKFPYLEDPPFPEEITITMEETPTFFLFERPSLTELDGTEEGRGVKRANERYEQRLEEAKTALVKKKIVHMETQTPLRYRRDERTMISRCKRNNNSTNVTTYDIYVTYKLLKKTKRFGSSNLLEDPLKQQLKQVEGEPDAGISDAQMRLGPKRSRTFSYHDDSSSTIVESSFMDSSRKNTAFSLQSLASAPAALSLTSMRDSMLEAERVFRTRAFQNAVFLVERILAGNVFEEKQKIFKGIKHEDEYPLEVEFKYSLELLWTYVNSTTHGRSVTSMCWNRMTENILAVGYGKYYYKDKKGGAVCCWCIKNPVQPERTCEFEAAVQAVDFSTSAPNLLAVGFYNGDVVVLDVSSRKTSVVARSDRETMTSFAPVWSVVWIHGDEHEPDDQLMTSSQDGFIFRYKRSKTFQCFPMMRVTRSEGKQRGVAVPRKCDPHDIPITCHPPALTLCMHPAEQSVYYVGTGEGCIHKCSVDYLHHHLQMFVAHRGPVYCLQFSPFSHKLFLTSGADFCVRMWADGVLEPLFSLTVSGSRDPVMHVSWSTVHPTVIASVAGSNIYIWDIGRKIAAPVSVIESPNADPNVAKSRFTTITFTRSGDVIVAGDVRGNLHVMACKDMPFPMYFQEEALVSAVINALATRPDLLKELRRCYPLAEELAAKAADPMEKKT